MKINKSLLTLALFIGSIHLIAQNPIVVNVSPSQSVTDTQHSFVVVIPNANLKEVKKEWLQYQSKGSKGSASETNGENLQVGVVNTNVSPTPFNVFSRLIETNEGVRLNAWLDARSITNAPNSGTHLAMQKYVYDFAVQQYKSTLQRDLKEAESKLQLLEKQFVAMVNSEEKGIKKVNSNERANSRSDDAVLTNNNDIKTYSEKIDDQKGMVDYTAADANANKGAKKTLKEMKNEKRDLQKDSEKRGQKIDKRNKENRAFDRSSEITLENQRAKTNEIEQQKIVVAALKAKLAGI